MNTFLKTGLGITVVVTLTGCDVDGLMLAGKEADSYAFTNDALPEHPILEEKIYQFSVKSSNGSEEADIRAVYLGDESQIATGPVIVYCHGNGPNMNSFWPKAAWLANVGGLHAYGVVMFDYRGFGLSSGETTHYTTMVADLDAVLKWLKNRGLTADRTILYGESLGSIPAGHGATEATALLAEKVILEAPQSSVSAILGDVTGISLPGTTVTDMGFDLPQAIGDYPGALLWIHGTADAVAPLENAELVYGQHRGSFKRKHIEEGAGHLVFLDMGFERWSQVVQDFIEAEP
jgi:pimeloyl-ACP methyl ester carboxylesterase